MQHFRAQQTIFQLHVRFASSRQACNKCTKVFPTEKFGDKPDFSGYDCERWCPRLDSDVKDGGLNTCKLELTVHGKLLLENMVVAIVFSKIYQTLVLQGIQSSIPCIICTLVLLSMF